MKQFNLNEYLKNPSRKIVTRDGRSVRIICTDAKDIYPIIALIELKDVEMTARYTKYGTYNLTGESEYDLFFAPEKHEGWINVYKHEGENVFSSKAEAEKDGKRFSNYIATVKIEWEE